MTTTITVHDRAPDPEEWPILFTADGEPLLVPPRQKVIGFHGRVNREEK